MPDPTERALGDFKLPDHRPKCSSCSFSALPVTGPAGAPLQCRRHPPVVALATIKIATLPPGLDIGPQPSEVLQALTNFPAVQPEEWCGEYEPNSQSTAVDG